MTDFIDLPAITRRLKEVVERSGLSSKEFAERTDIAPATLSQNINERSPINVASINKILATFPELVDPYWFVFGESGKETSLSDIETAPQLSNNADALQAILRKQVEEISQLKAELELQRKKEIAHITVFYTDNSFSTFDEKK